jgi:DEAD/DEAH box helicase domain-containing protein
MHTTSYWFTIPKDRLESLPFTREELIDGLSGLSYTLHHLAAMLLMADVRDLDRCVGDKSGAWFVRHSREGRSIVAGGGDADAGAVKVDAFDPTIFIYDAYPGGIGFSALLFAKHDQLLAAAKGAIERCRCGHGCPSCVGPPLEVGEKGKAAALAILKLLGA